MIDGSIHFRRSKGRWSIHIPRPQARLKENRLRERFRLPSTRDLLENAPRWCLCLLLVAAPWAYGTTFPATKDLLAGALLAVIGLFILSLVLRGRWPRMHWLPGSLTLILLAIGWFVTWNVKMVYDPDVLYFHLVQPRLPSFPGTVDQAVSFHQMLLITGLVGAFWVATDLAANPRWLDRVWFVMSLTGVSLMMLGIAQRVTGAPGIFWDSKLDCGTTFFATYRYHANAGAFINLVFPLIVGRTALALHGRSSDLGKAFWTLASLVTVAAAFINVSRAAAAITLALTAALVWWQVSERLRDAGPFFTKRRISAVSIFLLAGVGCLVWGIGFKDALTRWLELSTNIATNGRFLADTAIVQYMLPAAGLWGFGPASFRMTFPFFTTVFGARLGGLWEYAHCDYLQTLAEWGIVGALLWFLLFGFGLGRTAWVFLRSDRRLPETTRTFLVVFLLALTSVVVHAAVDFPLQIASLQLYVAVVLGLVTSVGLSQSIGRRRGRRKTSTVPGPATEEVSNAAPVTAERI